jgi:hypothetical protein
MATPSTRETSMAIQDHDKELERAVSDYLAISRSAHMFEPDEYERAEAEAWERIQALSATTEEPVPA